MGLTWANPITLGAFTVGSKLGGMYRSDWADFVDNKGFSFKASLSNNIYGRSSHVRTKNTSIRIWKRIS